ncbi:DnaJ domain-containing protein [Desulforhabdus amnigena]|uniref:J domain-containing protein n=1 Tax=Desulforhabdus amnigena TaxID=40218 RepID=A0A9W6D3H9_9BACT|nr:DnaJ domain-containing protein [Desulforhabdus amnigena]NLJ29583.1 DnaJ domain-containing protein [Deltaproteobacteria bacterium]GLI33522.1 hypothetical protein DAMNIGENAA_09550 [Desulforhabdus amnigena]
MPSNPKHSPSSDYDMLQLGPGATLTELKRAYRNLAKQWHPDRFQHLSSWEQRAAEERFKEITSAYHRILAGWKDPDLEAAEREKKRTETKTGKRPVHNDRPFAVPPERPRTRPFAFGHFSVFFGRLKSLLGEFERYPFRWHILLVGGAILALFFLFNVLWWSAEKRALFHDKGMAKPERVADRRPEPFRSEESVSLLQDKAKGVPPALLESSTPPPAPPMDPNPSFFTLGSSREEVRQVQGIPHKVKGNTWSYGLSEIQFRDGRVARYNNFDGSLRVRLVPSGPLENSPLVITLGSTKDDVIRALGTPTRVMGNRWYYGFSEIRFKEDRLIGFDNFFEHVSIRLNPSGSHGPAVQKQFFTVGSTRDEVLAVQGTPTSIQGSIWFYRSSHIQFRDEKVQSVFDAEGNLRFVAPEGASSE